MSNEVQSFLLIRGLEVTGDQVELCIGGGKLMLAFGVARAQSGAAGIVIDVQVMQTMRNCA